jgi:hypothetical protein
MPRRKSTEVRMLARLAAIALALILAPLPASAAFLERHGHWIVAAASQSACAAFNRPLEEFNAAPYAALSIRQRRGEPARLQVFAWPDVFKAGQRTTIEIGSGLRTEVAAQAPDSYFVEATDALPDAAIAEMRAAGPVEIRVRGLPQMLVFDLSQIDAIMKSLDTCVRQLGRSP